MTVALIMAGGRSERMRASSGNTCHKALRHIHGMSLLERNLRHVLRAGVDQVFVATNPHENSIQDFVRSQAREIAADAGAEISCLIEDQPLGTIGVAQRLANVGSPIIVLNVDNLTTLCLRDLVAHRDETGAAICIATHMEGFQVPLGQVICKDGEITEYREKPIMPVRISSGAYVLASRVCNWIEPNKRTDIPELIPIIQARKERVVAFEHDAVWIDINDADTLSRAEKLVSQHQEEFANLS